MIAPAPTHATQPSPPAPEPPPGSDRADAASTSVPADRTLGEFFGDLAIILSHGRRRVVVRTETETGTTEEKIVLGPILSWPFALGLVAAAALVAAPLLRGAGDPLPEGLLGRWTTDDPRYADRSLEITPTSVTVRVDRGSTGAPARPITHVSVKPMPRATFVTIEYDDEAGTEMLELAYLPPPFGTFTLRNPAEAVWRRADAGGAAGRTAPAGDTGGRRP